jgi:hypothetical protein
MRYPGFCDRYIGILHLQYPVKMLIALLSPSAVASWLQSNPR